MNIDPVSSNIVRLALYLDNLTPGFVSEIWLEDKLVQKLRNNVPNKDNLGSYIDETKHLIASLPDKRRKRYLTEILGNLTFLLKEKSESVPLTDFYKHTFGFPIQRVSKEEISRIELNIQTLETQLNMSRFEVFQQHVVQTKEIVPKFQSMGDNIKKHIPQDLLTFPDGKLIFELVSNKPWEAFNTHIKPFTSKLSVNLDIDIFEMNLHHMAAHEGYAGHHTELSNKDILLTNEGRGEHGLVITYSAQTFISEAIADVMYVILGILDKSNPVGMISWHYGLLKSALQNLATFLYIEDHWTKAQIEEELKKYTLSDKARQGMLSFSTDPVFSRYAPIYYSAFNFLEPLYAKTSNKKKLIHTLFTQPCTASLLTEEFGK